MLLWVYEVITNALCRIFLRGTANEVFFSVVWNDEEFAVAVHTRQLRNQKFKKIRAISITNSLQSFD